MGHLKNHLIDVRASLKIDEQTPAGSLGTCWFHNQRFEWTGKLGSTLHQFVAWAVDSSNNDIVDGVLTDAISNIRDIRMAYQPTRTTLKKVRDSMAQQNISELSGWSLKKTNEEKSPIGTTALMRLWSSMMALGFTSRDSFKSVSTLEALDGCTNKVQAIIWKKFMSKMEFNTACSKKEYGDYIWKVANSFASGLEALIEAEELNERLNKLEEAKTQTRGPNLVLSFK